MARAQGARAQMALAYETVYGAPPVSGFRLMPFARTTLGSEQPLLESELLGYGRDPLAPIKDAVTADGEVVIPIDVEAFGFWLKAAFGQPTTTGTTPKTHTFQSGNWTLPSMAIETAMPEVPRFAMYSGCVLDQLTWQMQRSGLLTATARLVAQGETIAAATAAGTPTALGLQRFGHFNGTVKRNGSSLGNVISAEITCSNNLDRIETIRGDGRIDGADPAMAALSGRIEVRFSDTTLITQAIDGTPCELEFNYSLGANASFIFTAHAVYDHADAASAPAIYDHAYLQSNITGGEGFDWFYASPSDRTAQVRTPISDGAAAKPWVFRFKDLRTWWQNPHFNRPGGVESGTSTAWVPQSKPIWFTELGCPAIDRGTNQPNVFFDPKSSESFTPYFSRGWRDDAIQRAYLEATYLFWGAAANNPTSSVYGNRMVHVPECAAWTWDARPYPFFPELTDVWTDGPNWRLGHWLTGRLGAVSLAALVRHLCLRTGMPEDMIDVSGLSGAVEGYVISALEAPRASISTLARHFGFDAVESEGRIKFLMRGRIASATATPDSMVWMRCRKARWSSVCSAITPSCAIRRGCAGSRRAARNWSSVCRPGNTS